MTQIFNIQTDKKHIYVEKKRKEKKRKEKKELHRLIYNSER
jgi:hypothetical protein